MRRASGVSLIAFPAVFSGDSFSRVFLFAPSIRLIATSGSSGSQPGKVRVSTMNEIDEGSSDVGCSTTLRGVARRLYDRSANRKARTRSRI